MKHQQVLANFEAARAASDLQRKDSLLGVRNSSTMGLSIWLHQRLCTELEHAERVARAANHALRQLQELQ